MFYFRTRSSGNVPRKGERVYAGTELGNGTVIDIDWALREVIVVFQEGETESYEIDRFFGQWTDSFGGCWWLEED